MPTHNIPTRSFVNMNYSLEDTIYLLTTENFNLKQQIREYQVVLDQAHREIKNLNQALDATNKATDQDSQEKRLNDDFDRFNLRPKIYTK